MDSGSVGAKVSGEVSRVNVHPSLCIGWGECHRWAPDVYHLDEEGHLEMRRAEIPPEHAEEAYLGAKACPHFAISWDGPIPERWKIT